MAGKAWTDFALKRYDRAIEAARQALAVNQTGGVQYTLALAGHETDAREALKSCLALPSIGQLTTIAAFKAYLPGQGGPAAVEVGERIYDALRKAGMPEGDTGTN
jgi:hypothetical protein